MELLAYLQTNGLSMAAFAERVGVNQSTISRVANHVCAPEPELAVKIVNATQGAVQLWDLYTGVQKKFRCVGCE